MNNKQYTFRELMEKYQWNAGARQEEMIKFAKARGVIIKEAETQYKKMKKFIIIDDTIANYNWTSCKLSGYEVCKEGLIRNIKNKRIWTSIHNEYVYVKNKDTKQDYAVHRLIMETFNPIKDSQNYIVDHINGIKTDNNINNLRWISAKGNQLYKIKNWDKISNPIQELLQLVGYEKMIEILENEIKKWKK